MHDCQYCDIYRAEMMSLRAASVSLARRCLSTNTPAMAAAAQADPIQSLFVNKIQEYAAKKKAADGGMVDATPETQAELQAELDKVAKAYGGGPGIDMTTFPDLKFADLVVDPIDISA